jgi:hypothetical protein
MSLYGVMMYGGPQSRVVRPSLVSYRNIQGVLVNFEPFSSLFCTVFIRGNKKIADKSIENCTVGTS